MMSEAIMEAATSSAEKSPAKISSKESSLAKTPTKNSPHWISSKESSISKTSGMKSPQTMPPSKEKFSKEGILQGASSKESSIGKTSPKPLQESYSNRAPSISLIEQPSIETPTDGWRASNDTTEYTPSIYSEGRRSKDSKSLRISSARESQITQMRSPRSPRSKGSMTSKDSRSGKRSNRSLEKNSDTEKSMPSGWRTSKISVWSSDSKLRDKLLKTRPSISSTFSLKSKLKHHKSRGQLHDSSQSLHIYKVRRAEKPPAPPSQQRDILLRRGTQESADSLLEEITTQTEDEEPDGQANRYYFINAFKNLPDMEDISESTSDEEFRSENVTSRKCEELFITRSDNMFRSKTSELDAAFDEGGEVQHTPGYRTSSDSNTSTITLDSLIESEDDDYLREKYLKPTHVNIIDMTQSLMAIDPKVSNTTVDEVESDDAPQVVLNMTKEICRRFVFDIINNAVDYYEKYSNKLNLLLDKEKLIYQLDYLIDNYQDELYRVKKLEKAVADYFLRRKHFSALTEPKERDTFNATRFTGALEDLDQLLQAKKEATQLCQTKTGTLRERAEEARIYCEQKLYDFETIVKQTLCNRDGYDHLKSSVQDLLKRMEHFRNEVYEMRLALRLTQHQVADMKLQSAKMEDLGGGLNIHEYLSTQAATEALASKIAEKSGDLKRLSDKHTYDLHAMAHWKCKEQIGQSNLHILKQRLKKCEEAKLETRQRIYKGKLKHNKIMKEISDLKSTGLLMHYPALMHDYDLTMESVDKKREAVVRLREEHDRLEIRIHRVEAGSSQKRTKPDG